MIILPVPLHLCGMLHLERENYEVQTQSSAVGNMAVRSGGQGYGAGNKA